MVAQSKRKQPTKKTQPANNVNYNVRGTLIIVAAVSALTLLLITGITYEDVLF